MHIPKSLKFLFTSLVLMLAAANTSAQTPVAPGRAAPLRPGDAVVIDVWQRPELSGTFEIDELGQIQHPLYHTLQIGGQSQEAVEAMLFEFLKNYDAQPRFVLRAMMKVFVEGQVARPNIYRVVAPTTMTEAIAIAGGTIGRPDLQRVALERAGKSTLYDLRNVDIRDPRLVLQSGDRVIVKGRRSLLRDIVLPAMSLASGTYSILRVVRILKN